MAGDTRAWARVIYDGSGLVGDESRHLSTEGAEAAINEAKVSFVRNWGSVDSIVVRCGDGSRSQPVSAHISVEKGLHGDRWVEGEAVLGHQLSMMNLDVAAAIANGQSIALFGDNFFTRLDLGKACLPVGTRLRLGRAVVQVSETPHLPCARFRARFGAAAFEKTAKTPRLRGIYLTVIEGGAVALGDQIRRV